MNRQVKRYAIISDNWDYVESPTGGFIDRDDFAALEAECDALWSTYVALVDKLGIDTEKAKTADGKPSDVIVSYVDALRAENDRLRKALEHCSEVMKDPWKHGEGCISRAINRADAALAASTGQEVEKQ